LIASSHGCFSAWIQPVDATLLISLPVDPDFHFTQTRFCNGIPLQCQAVGISRSGSLADAKPDQLRVEINKFFGKNREFFSVQSTDKYAGTI
jgi:hypothetical protein